MIRDVVDSKDNNVAAEKNSRTQGLPVGNAAFSLELTERLMKQDLNPVKVMKFFALGLRGNSLKQVTA